MIMSRFKFLILSLLLGLLMTGSSQAELYTWVDDQGKVHYGDSPPDNARLKKIRGNISSFSSVTIEPFELDESLLTTRKKARTVVMYSTSWCGYCKQAVKHFKKHKIPFKEYDVEKSAKGAADYKKLKGRGVPIILIGKRRMNGFNAETFDRIYFAKS